MTFVGAGEWPEVLCLFLEVLLPDFLDLNQVEDSWANLAALPSHILGVMAGVLSGADHPLAVLAAVLTGAQDAGQGSKGAEGWVPHFPMGVRLSAMHTGFLMFLLQDNLDCCAACPLRSEVARNEAQRGAEPGGGWGAQATLSPTVP